MFANYYSDRVIDSYCRLKKWIVLVEQRKNVGYCPATEILLETTKRRERESGRSGDMKIKLYRLQKDVQGAI